MSGMGGGGSQQVVQSDAPWEAQQPFLRDVWKQAQGAYRETPQNRLIARPTTAQRQGLRSQRQGAEQQMEAAQQLVPAGQAIVDLGTRTAEGAFLSPDSNPFLQEAIQAALAPARENFEENIAPALQSTAIAQGAYGGSRDALVEGRARRDLARLEDETAARMAYENYGRERQAQMQAPQLVTAGGGLLAAPGAARERLGAIQFDTGTAEQGFEQDLINEAIQLPWVGLPEYANIIQAGNFGTTTSQRRPSAVGQAIQGGLGGAALGGTFANQIMGLSGAGAIAPWAAGGAALGGLAGIF